MPLMSNKIEYLVGNAELAAKMEETRPIQPFEPVMCAFLNDISNLLLKQGRAYSDVATFGFWCRNASLGQMKQELGDLTNRIGRGLVFHSTPSNVAVNFAFSLAAGLLSGNANIVRLPAKTFPQVSLISSVIKTLLEQSYPELKSYVCLLRYASDKDITDKLSKMCDVRMVWGGDQTIDEIRRSPLRPRAFEINFSDRYSICIIDSDGYLRLSKQNRERAIMGFYNDTYFSDQNACTSPRLIVWTGGRKQEARKQFWDRLNSLISSRYKLLPIQAVGKLAMFTRAAAVKDGLHLEETADNRLWRIRLDKLEESIMDFKYHSGFFFEYEAEHLGELLPILNQRCQTVSYLACKEEAIRSAIFQMRPRGVDRIVPVGKTMEFSLVWDGHDLIRALSRVVG